MAWKRLKHWNDVAGLVFLLTACTPACGIEVPPSVLQFRSLTQQSLNAYRAGDSIAAQAALKAAHDAMATNRLVLAPNEFKQFSSLTKIVNAPRVNAAGIRTYEEIIASVAPLNVPPAPAEGILRRAYNAQPSLFVVRRNVAHFSTEFQKGVKSPADAFAQESARTSYLWTNSWNWNSTLIGFWERTPKEKRVFIVGSRSDAPYVKLLKERYRAQGYMFVFYLDCVPECFEATIGAFSATAGTVLQVVSPEAANSSYVAVEAGKIAHNQGKRQVLVIDGEQATNSMLAGGTAIGATLLACEFSVWVSNDPLCNLSAN